MKGSPTKCERCGEPGVGFDDDGAFMCEDCLFEDVVDEVMGDIVAGRNPDDTCGGGHA